MHHSDSVLASSASTCSCRTCVAVKMRPGATMTPEPEMASVVPSETPIATRAPS